MAALHSGVLMPARLWVMEVLSLLRGFHDAISSFSPDERSVLGSFRAGEPNSDFSG